MMETETTRQEREQMVREQIERRGIRDPRLLAALRRIPRHLFVPPAERSMAYSDGPLPIGHGQTISQPYIVALMTELAELTGSENVLEVGTGSGYQAALLACLARSVHTIELHAELAEQARQIFTDLELENIYAHTGDGSLGWQAAAPYDAILVTAAAPQPPQPLFEQLAEGGRLVIPVGARGYQELQVWRRQGGELACRDVLGVAFVPLRGRHGWKEHEWTEWFYD
ncbi:MAG TPA: protein-L-isoaspartate(D-aspartate) O-methyltransferase [Anaerolineaceae bacterium]